MFKIYDGRDAFYQWDLDRKLIVEDNTISQVHFCNKTDECSLVCEVYTEGNLRVANVPNVLLQDYWRIIVYGYDANHTQYCETFDVIKRSKPEDYIYTDEELKVWEDLEKRVEVLEDADIDIDLTEYATKDYVNEAIKEGSYELIERIAITEDLNSIYRDLPNCKALIIKYLISPIDSLMYLINTVGFTNNKTTDITIALSIFGYKLGTRLEIYTRNGYYNGIGYVPSGAYSNTNQAFTLPNQSILTIPDTNYINSINVVGYNDRLIPAGTSIEIWGVKVDA